jgi:hypothetical protein
VGLPKTTGIFVTRVNNEMEVSVMEEANELMRKPFLNEKEVSVLTGRALSSLRNDRHQRRGIPYLKVCQRSIRYRLKDVIEFMERRRITFD